MKKRILSLLLAAALLLGLTGCKAMDRAAQLLDEQLQEADEETQTDEGKNQAADPELFRFADLTYTRPDPAALEAAAQAVTDAAPEASYAQLCPLIEKFYTLYWDFYTMENLALAQSDADRTDEAAWAEYIYCGQCENRVDQAFTDVLYACANSACSVQLEENFFHTSLEVWSTRFVTSAELAEIYDKELELIARYQRLSDELSGTDDEATYDPFGQEAAQIYLELIKTRNAEAACWGYGNYSELYFDQSTIDYTALDLQAYLEDVKTYLVPLYRQLKQDGAYEDLNLPAIDPEAAFVNTCDARVLKNDVGGASLTIKPMQKGGFYDVAASDCKRDTRRSTFLYVDTVKMPYLFLNPTGTCADYLRIANAIGYCDAICCTDGASVDLNETVATSMEYLLLRQPNMDDPELVRYKLLTSLRRDLISCAMTYFEFECYELSEEELTPDFLHHIFAGLCYEYGLLDDPVEKDGSWTFYEDLFWQPGRSYSYCLADTVGFNVYLMDYDLTSGDNAYMGLIMSASVGGYQQVLEKAGLPSPFASGQVQQQAKDLATYIQLQDRLITGK